MKLFKSLLLSVLFVAALSFTGCNEEPITPTSDNTQKLSKLTLPAGAVITNATFNIFVEDATNNGIDVHKVNVPWAEATETWNIFYAKTPPQWDPIVLGSFNSVFGWHSVDITALVQSWVADPTSNNGVLLNQPLNGNGFTTLRSREYNGGGVSDPYLEVTYTVGGGNPVTVQEPAFEDTYIWTINPDDNFGNEQYVRVARIDDYVKHALVKFDIEGTPVEECYQEETAWAANGSVPGSIRYVTRGNWATYLTYGGAAKTVNIYAGQNNYVGTATLTPVIDGVEIDIDLEGGWELNPMEGETVKIQGYTNTPPARNPAPGQFTTYKGTNLTVTVLAFNFYGIHLDVRKAIVCP